MFKFSFPEGNIKKNEGCVPHHIIETFPEVKEEVTGLFKFVLHSPVFLFKTSCNNNY